MPDADITDVLAKLTDAIGNLAGWQYTTADNAIETYDAAGMNSSGARSCINT